MPLADLSALVQDLWWTTDPAAERLWSRLGPDMFKAMGNNPVATLRAIKDVPLDGDTLGELATFVDRWPRGTRAENPPTQKRIAFFSMELGLHRSLPTCSSELGMLAGDHLRSAADLGISMVGVSLLFHRGHFIQRIEDGRQSIRYPTYDPSALPIKAVLGPDGAPVRVTIPDGGTEYQAIAWEARIGHVRLFLLDTHLPQNPQPVQELTQRLHRGDERTRLHQEMLLGFGGKQLLDTLGIHPDVFHINGSHAAPLTLALMAESVARGATVSNAWESVRDQCVYSAHPVKEDRLAQEAIVPVLRDTLQAAGISIDDWLQFGGDDGEEFSMSTLAAKGSRAINGVSLEHSERVQQQLSAIDTPIQTITSGVHPTAWLAEATQGLFNAHLPGWRTHIADPAFWTCAAEIPTQALITTRRALRTRLVDAIRAHTGEPGLLNPGRLTLGIADAFTPDRRANLIFTQPERLAAFLDRGAQIIFAGKANPEDAAGQALLEEVIQRSQEPELVGRIVFVPDYDPHWSRLLAQGCDVWVHHPKDGLQACGNTGQRAALNGNPNLASLTGWWREAADGTNGWTLQNSDDIADAMEIYTQLEGPVWSAFKDDEAWAEIMRRTLISCIPVFNSERMVRDFCSQLYEPKTR